MLSAPAAAQDATWSAAPGSNSVVTGTNWSGNTVPTGIGYFGASTTTALTTTTADVSFGGWTFNAGAADYTALIGNYLSFTGAGVVVNGGSVTFNMVSIYSALYFRNSSNAGNAIINNGNSGSAFLNQSNAGNAIINNSGTDGYFQFMGSSSGGNAVINNAGSVYFRETSSAGNAQLNNTASTGRFDFSTGTGPLGDRKNSAGSIAGAGSFLLGGVQLTIGGNDLSTTVTGVISDCGPAGNTCNAYWNGGSIAGGSLVKIGAGTLTLSGTNLYTGGTTFAGGTVSVRRPTISAPAASLSMAARWR